MERPSVTIEKVDPRDHRAWFEFARAIERDSLPDRIVLELDRDITIGELLQALTPAGFVISNARSGILLIHRKPAMQEAA
jgi:hypothetical protein